MQIKSINGNNLLDYHSAKDAGMIEPGIAPLCDAIRACGGNPLSSCEGHPLPFFLTPLFFGTRQSVRPFVMFSMDTEQAASLAQVLFDTFHGEWMISGVFLPGGRDLVWVIEPNLIDFASGKVSRKRVNTEICKVSKVLLDYSRRL